MSIVNLQAVRNKRNQNNRLSGNERPRRRSTKNPRLEAYEMDPDHSWPQLTQLQHRDYDAPHCFYIFQIFTFLLFTATILLDFPRVEFGKPLWYTNTGIQCHVLYTMPSHADILCYNFRKVFTTQYWWTNRVTGPVGRSGHMSPNLEPHESFRNLKFQKPHAAYGQVTIIWMGGIRERRMPPIPIMPKSLPQDPCREQGSRIQGTGGSSTGIGFLSIGNG